MSHIYHLPPLFSFSVNLQNGTFNQVNHLVTKRVEDTVEDKKYALIATPESVYKGDITNPGSTSVNTFLAVRNKRTNEISLIQVQEASFKVI